MSVLGQLTAAMAPWATFYSASSPTQTLVTFGHFGGMMVAGGSAVAADRGIFEACRFAGSGRLRPLDELFKTHRYVIAGLAVTSLSGLLMLAADLENLAVSPWFWLKMGLLTLLLFNGWFMTEVARQLKRDGGLNQSLWNRLRRTAVISLVLWFAVVLAGTLLTTA